MPANGDRLSLEVTAADTFNDLPDLIVDYLLVNNFQNIGGSRIIITNRIVNGGDVNLIRADVRVQGETYFVSLNSDIDNLIFEGEVEVNGLLWLSPELGARIKLGGFVFGSLTGSGTIVVLGPGRTDIDSGTGNGYSGTLLVNGNLFCNKDDRTAFAGPMIIGNGGTAWLQGNDQVPPSASILVQSGGTLAASSGTNNIRQLELHDDALVFTTNGGSLLLSSNVLVEAAGETARIEGRISFASSTRIDISGEAAPLVPELVIVAKIESGGFEKFGPGELVLRGTNSFTGTATLHEGTVELGSAGALGSTAGSTVWLGGTLRLRNAAIGNERLFVAGGSGITNRLDCPSGTVSSWAGPIEVINPLLVNVPGTGLLTFSGVMSAAGSLTKIGTGTLRLSGSTGNTHSGPVVVVYGLLELRKTVGNAVNGLLVIGDGISPSAFPVVRLFDSSVIGGGVTVNDDGLLDLNGYIDDLASLTLNGGTVETSGGTLSFAGTLTVGPQAQSSVFNGLWSLGSAGGVIDIATNATLNLQANVSGSGTAGLTKNGPGTLTLSGNNTYPGVTIFNAGRVVANAANVLGGNGVGTVLNGAALALGNLTFAFERLTNNSPNSRITAGPYESPGAVWSGDMTLNAELEVYVTETGGIDPALFPLTLSGTIGGSEGLRKTGPGRLRLSGFLDNVFSGDTVVHEGTLELGKTNGAVSIPNNLVVGSGPFGPLATARHLVGSSNTVGGMFGGSITVNGNGLYDLNGQIEGFPTLGDATPLRLYDGGDVQTGTGRLNIPAGKTVLVDPGLNGESTISGRLGLSGGGVFDGLHVFEVQPTDAITGVPALTVNASLEAITGAANVTKSGDGEMRVGGINTFTGPVNVNGGLLTIASATGFGATGGGVNVNNGGELLLAGTQTFTGETLTLNSTSSAPLTVRNGAATWNGPINLANDSTVEVRSSSSLRTLNAISGSGALIKSGAGVLYLAGSTANTYTNFTHHKEGLLILSNTAAADVTIRGPLFIGDDVGGANADRVLLGRSRQIANTSAVTIQSSGWLDLSGYSDAVGSLAGGGNVTTIGPSDFETGTDNTSATFSGVISGGANVWIHGSGTQVFGGTNTYTGLTVLFAGDLRVNGFQPQSAVVISNGNILGGSGTVGRITVASGGTVAPGNSAGQLNSSNATFQAGSLFQVELNGATAGTGYDRLAVRGTISLGGATLAPTLGFASSLSNSFMILENDGVDAITGTFAGLSQNAVLSVSSIPFRISYTGGTGNDVVLTQIAPLPSLTAQSLAGTNLVFSWPTNYSGLILEANTNLNTTLWLAVPGSPARSGSNFVVTNATSGPEKFFRLRAP